MSNWRFYGEAVHFFWSKKGHFQRFRATFSMNVAQALYFIASLFLQCEIAENGPKKCSVLLWKHQFDKWYLFHAYTGGGGGTLCSPSEKVERFFRIPFPGNVSLQSPASSWALKLLLLAQETQPSGAGFGEWSGRGSRHRKKEKAFSLRSGGNNWSERTPHDLELGKRTPPPSPSREIRRASSDGAPI